MPKFYKCVRDCDAVIEYYHLSQTKELCSKIEKLKELYSKITEESKEPDVDKLREIVSEMDELWETAGFDTVKKDVKIPKGWIFYCLGGTKCYNLVPVKKSSETNVTFDVKDKKDFKQGFWDDIRDAAVLKQLKLKELGNLSNYRIGLSAPQSCFEEI